MKIVGIICEYNPFHKGHAHQMREARRLSGADYVICAMSGPCMQRGDLAITDKWTRAKMALLGGADVVFELPALFAVRAAGDFARGGVSLLAAAGIDALSFGSEIANMADLMKLSAPPENFDLYVRSSIAKGISYPRAVHEAYNKALGEQKSLEAMPNAILAAEYIRAIHALNPKITPLPVMRERSGAMTASQIRALLLKGNVNEASAWLPRESLELLDGNNYNTFENISQAALFCLRGVEPGALARVQGMAEGIEMRFKKAAQASSSLDELFFCIKCKRYTMARIRRAALSAVLGITKELCAQYPQTPYLRLLGFRKSAAPLLSMLKDTSPLPIITKFANAQMSPCLALDMRAQDLFNLGLKKKTGDDFTISPVIL